MVECVAVGINRTSRLPRGERRLLRGPAGSAKLVAVRVCQA